jgi:hypothetical protein
MSLENPHKIAKKDGHLHEIAKKDHRLPYLVILCQHTVVRVSLGRQVLGKVRYLLTKYTLLPFCSHKMKFQ